MNLTQTVNRLHRCDRAGTPVTVDELEFLLRTLIAVRQAILDRDCAQALRILEAVIGQERCSPGTPDVPGHT